MRWKEFFGLDKKKIIAIIGLLVIFCCIALYFMYPDIQIGMFSGFSLMFYITNILLLITPILIILYFIVDTFFYLNNKFESKTLFIFLEILFLLALFILEALFFISITSGGPPPMNNTYSELINNYVESCIKSVAESKLEEINNISDLELSNELNQYIDNNLDFCIGNFQQFVDQGYQINSGEVQTNTEVNEEDIIINVEYSLNITKDSVSANRGSFQVSLQR